MTTLPILRWQLRDGIRGLIAWSLALIAVLCVYLPIYPSIHSPALTEMVDSLPQQMSGFFGMDSIATGAGYTQATFFGLLGYVLAAIACISWGSKAIAGAEDSGRLEMILTHAVGRGRYALESLLALTGRVVVLCVIAATAILILNGPSDLGLAPSHIVITTCVWGMLALTSGITALSVGAMTGRPSWAIGAGAALTVVSYIFDAITRTTTNLNWLSYFSPYHWAYGDSPLQTGNAWGGMGLLAGLCAVLFALGYAAFTRRDVC